MIPPEAQKLMDEVRAMSPRYFVEFRDGKVQFYSEAYEWFEGAEQHELCWDALCDCHQTLEANGLILSEEWSDHDSFGGVVSRAIILP